MVFEVGGRSLAETGGRRHRPGRVALAGREVEDSGQAAPFDLPLDGATCARRPECPIHRDTEEERGRCPARSSKSPEPLSREAGWFDSIPPPPRADRAVPSIRINEASPRRAISSRCGRCRRGSVGFFVHSTVEATAKAEERRGRTDARCRVRHPASGSARRSVVPRPSTLCTVISPPCASAIRRAIARPRPVPSRLLVWNGSKTVSRRSGGGCPARRPRPRRMRGRRSLRSGSRADGSRSSP